MNDAVWSGVFEQMESFIRDVNLTPDVLEFLNQGIDTVLLPYFGRDGEQWLMTTPYLQVALNRDLEKDEARREKAMRVLSVMISEEGQTVPANGQDVISKMIADEYDAQQVYEAFDASSARQRRRPRRSC